MSDGPVCYSKRVAVRGWGFTVLGKDCPLITGLPCLGSWELPSSAFEKENP